MKQITELENYLYRRGYTVNITKNVFGNFEMHLLDRFIYADTIKGLKKLALELINDNIIATNSYIHINNIVHGIDDYVVLNGGENVLKLYTNNKGAYFKYYGTRYYLGDFMAIWGK